MKTALSPRRQPLLRLVGDFDPPRRNVRLWRIAAITHVVEVFASWADVPPGLRDVGGLEEYPGFGIVSIRAPMSNLERDDIQDIERQNDAERRGERGEDYS